VSKTANIRIAVEAYRWAQRAAGLSGESVSGFVSWAAIEVARRDVEAAIPGLKAALAESPPPPRPRPRQRRRS
jgi:uncharacterized protein (DUF1778 family)